MCQYTYNIREICYKTESYKFIIQMKHINKDIVLLEDLICEFCLNLNLFVPQVVQLENIVSDTNSSVASGYDPGSDSEDDDSDESDDLSPSDASWDDTDHMTDLLLREGWSKELLRKRLSTVAEEFVAEVWLWFKYSDKK
mgnify:CR=1 FL=1